MSRETPTPGEAIRVVAKAEENGIERRIGLTGKVSHVNGPEHDPSIWFEVDTVEYWWADEPRDLARERNESFHRETDVIGVSPLGDSNKYQVRVDSDDGFCNPIGELVEMEDGKVIA